MLATHYGAVYQKYKSRFVPASATDESNYDFYKITHTSSCRPRRAWAGIRLRSPRPPASPAGSPAASPTLASLAAASPAPALVRAQPAVTGIKLCNE